MKNVIDAVNGFKGGNVDCDFFIDKGEVESVAYFCGSRLSNDIFVCGIKDYEQCITELSHLAGEELFKEYLAADKTELEPVKEKQVDYTSEEFWKDAPEDATHYAKYGGTDDCYSWEYFINDLGYYAFGELDKPIRIYGESIKAGSTNHARDKFFIVASRPQPKPVYTKEMADNGELPPVGSEYLDEDNQLCKCLVNYGDLTIGIMLDHVPVNEYAALSQSTRGNTKPIDTRTSKEKAIDDLSKMVGDCESDYGILQAIIDGKVHGVTFKGEDDVRKGGLIKSGQSYIVGER